MSALKNRFILIITLLVVIITNANSQSYFGFKAGLNATRVSYVNEVYKEYYRPGVKPGYTGGLVVFLEHKNKFGLYTEFLYSMKGKYVESDANDYVSNSATYNYIDVPILFRVKFNQKKAGWYLQFGPEFNYWLGGKGTFKVYEPDRDTYTNYDYKVNFGEPIYESDYLNTTDENRLQLGICASAGMTWEMKNANYLALDLRFSMGHTFIGGYETASLPNLGIEENFEYTNNVLSASFIYYFDILEKARLGKNKYK